MRVECLVRSEFTVPGWTEFTVTLVPVIERETNVTEGNIFAFDFKLISGKQKLVLVYLFIDFILHTEHSLPTAS